MKDTPLRQQMRELSRQRRAEGAAARRGGMSLKRAKEIRIKAQVERSFDALSAGISKKPGLGGRD